MHSQPPTLSFSFSSLMSLSAQRVPADPCRGERRSTAGVYLVVRHRSRESFRNAFLAREGARARAQSGVTSGGTRISTRDEPLTWSNLKSYQSHLCQFSCLAWCYRAPPALPAPSAEGALPPPAGRAPRERRHRRCDVSSTRHFHDNRRWQPGRRAGAASTG